MATETETRAATIRVIAPQIFENIVRDYTLLESDDVLEIRAVNLQLAQGLPYAVLVDSGMMTTITKEARELSASKEFASTTVAKALLVRSVGHRLVGRIYIKVNKPHIRTKIFSDRTKAIQWLESKLRS